MALRVPYVNPFWCCVFSRFLVVSRMAKARKPTPDERARERRLRDEAVAARVRADQCGQHDTQAKALHLREVFRCTRAAEHLARAALRYATLLVPGARELQDAAEVRPSLSRPAALGGRTQRLKCLLRRTHLARRLGAPPLLCRRASEVIHLALENTPQM